MARTQARERGQTRARIVEAAARVLAERGYEAATIKEIARTAGVAPGLVHYYFADKDALLVAVLKDAATRHIAETARLGAERTPRAVLEAALDTRRRRVGDEPGWYRLRYELFALGLRNPGILPGVADLLADGRAGISEVLRHITPNGTLVPGEPASEATAAVFLAAVDGLGLQRLADPTFDLDAAYAVLARLAATLLAPTSGNDQPEH